MKEQLSPILPPLGKTNIDSDESANNDGRLFLVVCTQVGVCIRDCRVCSTQGVRVGGSRLTRDVSVKSQLAYSSASEAERSQQGAERSQFRPGERSYPAPIPQNRLKNERAGDRTWGALMRGQSLECTRWFIWLVSAICFSRIPIMLNEHKHTNREKAAMPGKQGWLHNPSSLFTPLAFFSAPPTGLRYGVRMRVRLQIWLGRLIFWHRGKTRPNDSNQLGKKASIHRPRVRVKQLYL